MHLSLLPATRTSQAPIALTRKRCARDLLRLPQFCSLAIKKHQRRDKLLATAVSFFY